MHPAIADLAAAAVARAYAMTGCYHASEPFCVHVPARHQRMVENGHAEPVDAYFAPRFRPHA